MLIYVDLVIALPIALLTIGMVIVILHANQASLSVASESDARMLGLYSRSQLLVSAFGATEANYSEAEAMAAALAGEYNLSVSITQYAGPGGGATSCPYSSVCRIVVLTGRLYVMEVS